MNLSNLILISLSLEIISSLISCLRFIKNRNLNMFISPLNLVMVEQNKQREYKENFSKNYSEILKKLNQKPLTRREIFKETGIKISEQALIKNYLKPMFEKKEIGFLEDIREHKGNVQLLKEGYDKKLNPNTNVCYIYTPNSAKFYKDLSDTFKHLPNQEGYKQLMDEICIPFNMIEMESKFQFNHLFNHSIVEMDYKKKGIKLTEEQIQEKMRSAEKNIMDFAKTKIRVDFPLKHLRKNVDGKDYLKIGNNLVEYNKLGNFINIMRDNMNPLMIWIAHKMKSNEERITIPMMDKMVELFIKIEEDPQIKV